MKKNRAFYDSSSQLIQKKDKLFAARASLRSCAAILIALCFSLAFLACNGLLSQSTSTQIAVESVSLDKASISLVAGETAQLIATVSPANATNQNLDWSSSDQSIATVDSSGKVSGVAAGAATVTAMTKDGGKTASCAVSVKAATIPVASISLNKSSTYLLVDGTEQLSAIIAPANATNLKVAWSSSDSSIATVDATGKVTGKAVGSATIAATTDDGGKKASCSVTVSATAVPVSGIRLAKSSDFIGLGGADRLIAIITPEKATNQNVSWSSSDAAIATVDAFGKVSGLTAGTATISVATEDGGKTASCAVTVCATIVAVTGVSMNKQATSLVIGGAEQLTATVSPASATNQNLVWTSSDASIATVDAGGRINGIAVGSATITATTEDGAKTATCALTVRSSPVAVTGISLSKATTTLLVGGTDLLVATVIPADATNQNIVWSSSSEAVASVDANGKVTGVAVGAATITVTSEDGAKTASCSVTVNPLTGSSGISVQIPSLVGVTLSGQQGTLYQGSSMTVTATPDATVDSYAWYVDGALSTASTGSAITVAANSLSLDRHSLTVVVTKGGEFYSASCYFTVSAPLPTYGVSVQNPSTISLSIGGQQASISQGSSMTVYAYASDSVDSYSWYIDGALGASSSYSSFTTPTNLGVGRHTLTLVAAKGAALYSASCYFTVTAGTNGITVQNPSVVTVSLSGLPATLALGSTANVYAYTSSSASSYAWYLDGALLSGQSTSYVTIGTGLGAGRHSLMVVVSQGGSLFTASAYFSVQ
jgi:Bacterial surface proteins containing Ig-like domains